MSREETIRLLQFLKGCYPNVRIDDPSGMVDAWMLAFSTEKAEDVYRGARFHMIKSRFFPTPADIHESMKRAVLIYDNPSKPALPEKKSTKEKEKKYLMSPDELWHWLFEED